jgi:CubicO group peptidase (beta-lactamase class C family)
MCFYNVFNFFPRVTLANDLSKQWQAPPSALESVDSTRLKRALKNTDKYPGLRSLLIVKDGFLVSENYFKKIDKDDTHEICSAAKTFIGVLIGIAIKQNYISDVNDPISKYLKKLPSGWDNQKDSITIKHLLSMTSGLEWTESDYDKLYESSDPVNYILSKPLIAKPGEKFNYDVSAYILSSI